MSRSKSQKSAPKVHFTRTPAFWQNVAAGVVASVIVLMVPALPGWFYSLAMGSAADITVKVLLGFATAVGTVIAIVAVVQLFRSEEKYKWLIIGFLWLVVAMLAWFTGIAFANR